MSETATRLWGSATRRLTMATASTAGQYLVAKISVRHSTRFVVPAQAGTQSLPLA